MSNAEMLREPAVETLTAGTVDMKLEVVVIPVSDVDRAKRFYGDLGWRLDIDYTAGDEFRVIQFTPPGSGCSVIFGKNVTAAAPGSVKGLHLIVSDIEAARDELLRRGIEISEPFHDAGGSAAQIRSEKVTPRTPRSAIPTAMAGCSRRSPCD
jgi:catechol 2,3-dioxygenase-like lactoylglutathione lyase family enzyme